MSELATVDPQAAHILLTTCLTGRAHHLTRTHMPSDTQGPLTDADKVLIDTAYNIADTHHPGATPAGTCGWVRDLLALTPSSGGIGLRLPTQNCDTGWVAAVAATLRHASTSESDDQTAAAYLNLRLNSRYTQATQDALTRIRNSVSEDDKSTIPQTLAELHQSASDIRQKALSAAVARQARVRVLPLLPEAIQILVKQSSDAWSCAVWSSPADAPQVDPVTFTTALRLRLGLGISWPAKCLCGRSDPPSKHLLNCSHLSVFSVRHEQGLKRIGQMLHRVGFQVRYEVMLRDHVPGGNQMRMDIVATRGSQRFAIDFTHISSNRLEEAELKKRNKYSTLCSQWGVPFQPVAVSVTGAVGPSSRSWLDWLVGQLSESSHPGVPGNPRAFLSGAFQFNQASGLIRSRQRALARANLF